MSRLLSSASSARMPLVGTMITIVLWRMIKDVQHGWRGKLPTFSIDWLLFGQQLHGRWPRPSCSCGPLSVHYLFLNLSVLAGEGRGARPDVFSCLRLPLVSRHQQHCGMSLAKDPSMCFLMKTTNIFYGYFKGFPDRQTKPKGCWRFGLASLCTSPTWHLEGFIKFNLSCHFKVVQGNCEVNLCATQIFLHGTDHMVKSPVSWMLAKIWDIMIIVICIYLI